MSITTSVMPLSPENSVTSESIILNFFFLCKPLSREGTMDRIGERPTTHPIHLRFKKGDGASDVTDFPLSFGWLNYTGIYEAYNFLWPYHSKQEKLRAMEKMLVLPGGPKIRLGI